MTAILLTLPVVAPIYLWSWLTRASRRPDWGYVGGAHQRRLLALRMAALSSSVAVLAKSTREASEAFARTAESMRAFGDAWRDSMGAK